ncbi:MAG TPA: cell division protein ZapA [Burkholderiaceae bacterium]|nr:cell division protein ZapA [Burkholderiaceae bacterium]
MDQIDVRILDRDYRLAVAPEDKARLLEAVRIVGERMSSVRDAGRVSGVERIAVMAALQIAHELMDARDGAGAAPLEEASRRVRKLTEDLDAELRRQESLF